MYVRYLHGYEQATADHRVRSRPQLVQEVFQRGIG
jgi:hypothetical protein